MRLQAIKLFPIWISKYYQSLVDYQLERLVDVCKTVAKLILDRSSQECQINGLKSLSNIIQKSTECHTFISMLITGDSSFAGRKPDSVDLSGLITSTNVKIRSEIISILRVCNKIRVKILVFDIIRNL